MPATEYIDSCKLTHPQDDSLSSLHLHGSSKDTDALSESVYGLWTL